MPRSGEVLVKGRGGVSMDVPRLDVSVESGPGIVLFSAADDVSGQREMSSRGTFHRRVCEWLERVPRASAPSE